MQVHSRVPPDATTKYEGGDETFPTLTKRVNVHVSVRGGVRCQKEGRGASQDAERE